MIANLIGDALPYGRTAAIWTASVDGSTYGSEPHMAFGGLRDSGTGWRDAGTASRV